MTHEQGAQRCAHPGCHCGVEPGKQFCSPHCAQAPGAAAPSGGCGCNHPACRQ